MTAAAETIVETAPLAHPTRPFSWLLRREFWENRSLYIVPGVVCGLNAVLWILGLMSGRGFMVNGEQLSDVLQRLPQASGALQRASMAVTLGMLIAVVSCAMLIVAFFYTLDALHSERRDRSILFWKSMPMSDMQTVLSKLFVATFGISAIAFAFTMVTHLLLTVATSIYLLAHGVGPALAWSSVSMYEVPVLYLYGLITHVFWFAPIYAWLIFVSAAARRLPFLWAILPPALVALCEYFAFGSRTFLGILGHRFAFLTQSHAFGIDPSNLMQGPERAQVPRDFVALASPVDFLVNPWLWVGLAIAGALVAGAIWVRRYREPL